jgi:hypothetical protein
MILNALYPNSLYFNVAMCPRNIYKLGDTPRVAAGISTNFKDKI